MLTKQNKTSNLEYEFTVTDGIVLLTNPNTTLGFVQPMYRRLGLAHTLLQKVKELTGKDPDPEPPISPLGRKLFKV